MLLKEMQIKNPAVMMARTAVAQDDITGDGTSSTVLIIGELLKQAGGTRGPHPRVIVEGFEAAKKASIKFLDEWKQPTGGAEAPDAAARLRGEDCASHEAPGTRGQLRPSWWTRS